MASEAAARTWPASGPKANLLSVEVNAAAAFQALASVRSQEELEISAIAANDTTIPLNEGKGDAIGKGRNVIDYGQEATEGSNINGNGGEADDDYQGGGEPNDESDGFVWNKKARKAAEKHRQDDAEATIKAKVLAKTLKEDARRQQAEVEQRQASALRKRSRELPQPQHQPPVQVQFQPQRANAEVNTNQATRERSQVSPRPGQGSTASAQEAKQR